MNCPKNADGTDFRPPYLQKTISWNPWHGCHRVSEGCRNCYMFMGDNNRGIYDSNIVKRSKTGFDLPLRKDRNGHYAVRDKLVLTSMTSDFFIEEADEWRDEAWDIIRKRRDVDFLILTKRPHRIKDCLPKDWGDGYPNVRLSVSTEDQQSWDLRVKQLLSVPARHHDVYIAPIIGPVDISTVDAKLIDCIYIGGEYGGNPRPCRFEWIEDIRKKCVENEISFYWRHCGERFVENGIEITYPSIRSQVEYCMNKNLDVIFDDPLPKDKQTVLFRRSFSSANPRSVLCFN